jgi:hypothetical protein
MGPKVPFRWPERLHRHPLRPFSDSFLLRRQAMYAYTREIGGEFSGRCVSKRISRQRDLCTAYPSAGCSTVTV